MPAPPAPAPATRKPEPARPAVAAAPALGARSSRRPVPPIALALAAVVLLAAGALGTGIVKLPGTGALTTGTSAAPSGPVESPPPIDNLATPAQGVLAVGDTSPVTTISLDGNGTSTTVSAPGQDWDGLEVDVPAGAWPGAKLQITAEPITRSSFGKLVTPISPLYTVSGATGMAPMPVTLKIPATIPAGYFAMGFFYDDASGHLEGMPLLAEDGTSVTVATEHFSSAFVSLVERALLPATIDSGFRPGVDDWPFPNYGSYVAQGHCAGQTLTEAWYYIERHVKGGAPPLHKLYDNNGGTPTPDLWQDDSHGYRLAGVAQTQYDARAKAGVVTLDKFFRTWRGLGFDTLQYDAFRYAMTETAEPQLVSLSDAQNGSGHAMLVYRVDPSGLYIADPNYPGQPGQPSQRRLIPFDGKSGKFGSYSSGVNAKVIESGDIDYVNFVYKAKSALVDWSVLADDWALFDQGKIGIGVYPTYSLEVLSGKDAKGQEVWVPLVDGYKTAEKTLKLRIRDKSGVDHTRMAIYDGTSSVPVGLAASEYSINFIDGPNPIGILEEGSKSGTDWGYVDFVRLTVIIEPAATPTPTSSPTSQAGGHWVLTSTELQGGAAASSTEFPIDKYTVDSANGRYAVSYYLTNPTTKLVWATSVTWGPPPTSAAPGDTLTMAFTVRANCADNSYANSTFASVGAGAKYWTAQGVLEDSPGGGADTDCEKGPATAEWSWAFPAYYGHDSLQVGVQAIAGPKHVVVWTYTYQWQP